MSHNLNTYIYPNNSYFHHDILWSIHFQRPVAKVLQLRLWRCFGGLRFHSAWGEKTESHVTSSVCLMKLNLPQRNGNVYIGHLFWWFDSLRLCYSRYLDSINYYILKPFREYGHQIWSRYLPGIHYSIHLIFQVIQIRTIQHDHH